MGQSARRGKHKKKHRIIKALCLLLTVVLTAAVVLGIRTVPKARRLREALTAPNCAITLQASLNMDKLTADQQKFLMILSEITGLERTEWNSVTLHGGYDGEAVRLAASGESGSPLTELYLTRDCQAIDIHAIYDRAYAHLTHENRLLDKMLPQWSLGDYISLQQLEHAFELELGQIPDIREKLEEIQGKLSLPMLCGAVLAADEWDRQEQKLVYRITDTDRRLELARQLAQRMGIPGDTDSWNLPEGMELYIAVYLGEPRVRTVVTGNLPGAEQIEDWSLELTWAAYTPESSSVSMLDQRMIDDLARLLRLLTTIF